MHTSAVQRIYMIGFLPGQPYMGDLPAPLRLPRRDTPRTSVPAGSVAIATTMTVIYPQESPGGWHIIARTPARLFDASRQPPALLAAGDEIVFRAISRAEFDRLSDGAATERLGVRAGSRRHMSERPHLRIVSAGLSTTVQDAGRIGWQRFGVPVSGALDRVALAAANVTVGNPATTAALECLYQGPIVEVAADCVRLAVAGTGASLEIEPGPGLPSRVIPAYQSVRLERGARAQVKLSGTGISAYLAIEGGIDVPPVLGSRSTYVRAGIRRARRPRAATRRRAADRHACGRTR